MSILVCHFLHNLAVSTFVTVFLNINTKITPISRYQRIQVLHLKNRLTQSTSLCVIFLNTVHLDDKNIFFTLFKQAEIWTISIQAKFVTPTEYLKVELAMYLRCNTSLYKAGCSSVDSIQLSQLQSLSCKHLPEFFYQVSILHFISVIISESHCICEG